MPLAGVPRNLGKTNNRVSLVQKRVRFFVGVRLGGKVVQAARVVGAVSRAYNKVPDPIQDLAEETARAAIQGALSGENLTVAQRLTNAKQAANAHLASQLTPTGLLHSTLGMGAGKLTHGGKMGFAGREVDPRFRTKEDFPANTFKGGLTVPDQKHLGPDELEMAAHMQGHTQNAEGIMQDGLSHPLPQMDGYVWNQNRKVPMDAKNRAILDQHVADGKLTAAEAQQASHRHITLQGQHNGELYDAGDHVIYDHPERGFSLGMALESKQQGKVMYRGEDNRKFPGTDIPSEQGVTHYYRFEDQGQKGKDGLYLDGHYTVWNKNGGRNEYMAQSDRRDPPAHWDPERQLSYEQKGYQEKTPRRKR